MPEHERTATPREPNSCQPAPSRDFIAELMRELPRLRGGAILMTRKKADADDLIQTVAVRALAAHAQFSLGTNMRAWLYRIMRNEFINAMRDKRHNNEQLDDVAEHFVSQRDRQEENLQMRDLMRALLRLTPIHREALYLSTVEGLPYESVAVVQGCAVGTVKSRIARARQAVKSYFDPETNGEPRSATPAAFDALKGLAWPPAGAAKARSIQDDGAPAAPEPTAASAQRSGNLP